MNREDVEALLGEVASGARSMADPEVQRLFAAEPKLRDDLERLRRLADELEGLGRTEREFLTTMAEPARPASAAMPPRRRWPWLALATLAAALVAFAVWLGRDPGVPIAGENHRLGSGEVGNFEPAPDSTVANVARFAWPKELPRDGMFVLEVRRREADGSRGAAVFPPVRTTSQVWTPGDAEQAQLHGPLIWRVQAFGLDGPAVFSSPWMAVTVAH